MKVLTPKSLFRYFFVTLNFSGFRALKLILLIFLVVADQNSSRTELESGNAIGSRLSFPATDPRTPEGVSEGVSEGSLKGS